MTQAYSDPTRETDPYALPDVEVFYMSEQDLVEAAWCDEIGQLGKGWYYWLCFPGCLPDSDPIGPFETEEEALKDAQDND